MDNPQATRRLRLYRSTWVVGLVVLILGTLLVLPGTTDSRFYSKDLPKWFLPTVTTFEHGWPFVFLRRSALVDELPTLGVPWLWSEAWKVWEAKHSSTFLPSYLVIDLLVLVAPVVLIAVAWEWRRRRRSRLFQFSLADMLLLCCFLAIPLGWYVHLRDDVNQEVHHLKSLNGQFHGRARFVRESEQVVPDWLIRLVGCENLPSRNREFVCAIELELIANPTAEVLEAALPHFQGLGRMELIVLQLPKAAHARSFRCIAQIPQLRRLVLYDNDYQGIVDEELAEHIAQLQRIDYLELSFEQGVTDEAKQVLRERMPNCTFEFFEED